MHGAKPNRPVSASAQATMNELPPVQPGMTIGILGGGQLGRMLALAAAELGLSCHIFCPDEESPAFAVAARHTIAPYDDETALAAFASSVSVATFEFENVPAATAHFLAPRVPLLPGPRALEVAQDRLAEKDLMGKLGIPVAPYAEINSLADIAPGLAKTGLPAVLKTRRMGYDGKGQAIIRDGDHPATAWRTIGEEPAILEAFVPFTQEISIVLGRGRDGDIRAYDLASNEHESGILARSCVPAHVSKEVAAEANAIGERVAEALDYVGVLAVEMFLLAAEEQPRLLVNEIAPRVHNSGHWTQDGCLVSQFEQHIRAIAGWSLGDPARHSNVAMTNLIGDDAERWATLAAEPGARLHLYGKSEVRSGRKMGHVNRILGPA
jgi:5-(carboxyamino)imidazole ribonucleotide synthase